MDIPDPQLTSAYQARLRALCVRLWDVRETERKQIARDLHHQVGHELGLARMKLSEIIRSDEFEKSPALVEPLKNLEGHLKKAVRQTRAIGYNYCPHILYDAGFLPALGWLADNYVEQNNICVRVKTNASAKKIRIPEKLRSRLFTAVRECIHNASTYAEASAVTLYLSAFPDSSIQMEVIDDGKGFDVERLNTRLDMDTLDPPKGGFGLFSIREMIEYLGGTFSCKSSFEKGTHVIMKVPLHLHQTGSQL